MLVSKLANSRNEGSALISFDDPATAAFIMALDSPLYIAERVHVYITSSPRGACETSKSWKFRVARSSAGHLCSKFTQLDITLTRRMFGIIKLLPVWTSARNNVSRRMHAFAPFRMLSMLNIATNDAPGIYITFTRITIMISGKCDIKNKVEVRY